jgi:hypothetical protein
MNSGEYLEVQTSKWCPVCYRQMSVEGTMQSTDLHTGLELTTIKWRCEACAKVLDAGTQFDLNNVKKAYDVERGSELTRSQIELALRGQILSVDVDPLAEDLPFRKEGYLYDVKISVSAGNGEHTFYWLAA